MKLIPLYILLFISFAGTSWAVNNYLTDNQVITPSKVPMPLKGSSYTGVTTGATWERRSDIADLGGAKGAIIVYSRFSPSNSNGKLLLVHGTNSTSCYIYRLSDNKMVADLRRDSSHQIGEINEIRWDYSGKFPNRVYFVHDMSFYYMDVLDQNTAPTLIHDFSHDFPVGVYIRNDVEGDSSSDSRYWAWQVFGSYDGKNFPRKAVFTYDRLTDKIIGILKIGDVLPASNPQNWKDRLPTPNMVEISPDGNYVITHYGRSFKGGAMEDWAGTFYDGPHAWPLDFSGIPVQVSADATHSGWGYLSDGTLVFVSQNNRTDYLEYCRPDGVGGVYPANCENFMKHSKYGYFGHHYAKMPPSRPGWILISTYVKINYTGWKAGTAYSRGDKIVINERIYRTNGGVSGYVEPVWPISAQGQIVKDGSMTWTNWGLYWPSNQLLMVELKPLIKKPRVWCISPMYNDYNGNYRDEAPAAVSLNGDVIYVTNNWLNLTNPQREVYEINISGWFEHFKNMPSTVFTPAPKIKSITPLGWAR